MLNKYRYPIILSFASFIFFLAGTLLLTIHLPGGHFMTISMVIAQAVSIIWVMTLFFKSRYPAIVFAGSFILFLVGLLFKIMHWVGAQSIICSTIVIQIIMVSWLIFSLLKEHAKT